MVGIFTGEGKGLGDKQWHIKINAPKSPDVGLSVSVYVYLIKRR